MPGEEEGGSLAFLPGVARILVRPEVEECVRVHGRALVVESVRGAIGELRAAATARREGRGPGRGPHTPEPGPEPGLGSGPTPEPGSGPGPGSGPRAATKDVERLVAEAALRRVRAAAAPSLRPVLNLSGTVLHTNLGRAELPEVAVEAMAEAARSAVNLEIDLATGKRGERDTHVEAWLARLTGAEAATVVNNNAAAVLLVLNTLALGREVPVSRGELIEIGGSFRLPEIMSRAGCRLVEVGTTNRTHLEDFARAIGERTGAVMTVHTSNYVVEGFTAAPEPERLASLARERGVPWVHDLGSGTLVELERFGLPHEPTPREALANGADLVTFSGDKLLGGPQSGIVAGRADLVSALRSNPMKRALRVDKITLAALGALLPLYAHPERLARELPALRRLVRPAAEVRALAERVAAKLRGRFAERVEVVGCVSRIGSGALPVDTLPSAGIALRPPPSGAGRMSGRRVEELAATLRALPRPVIGRIREGALVLDLRCLERDSDLLDTLTPLLGEETGAGHRESPGPGPDAGPGADAAVGAGGGGNTGNGARTPSAGGRTGSFGRIEGNAGPEDAPPPRSPSGC